MSSPGLRSFVNATGKTKYLQKNTKAFSLEQVNEIHKTALIARIVL